MQEISRKDTANTVKQRVKKIIRTAKNIRILNRCTSNEFKNIFFMIHQECSQPAFKCSKLTIETLEQGLKYVQS